MNTTTMNIQTVSNSINVYPNFPSEGIYFRDISPLLTNNELREFTFDKLANLVDTIEIDYIAGIESRGFIFGIALAQRLKCGFVMLRKPNKLPNTIKIEYGLEYGKDILTIQDGIIPAGKNVLIVDDLLATGGSLLAGCQLIEKIGSNVVGCLCLIELLGLPRKEKLNDYKLFSLLKYPSNSENKNVVSEMEPFNPVSIQYQPSSSVSDDRIIVFHIHP